MGTCCSFHAASNPVVGCKPGRRSSVHPSPPEDHRAGTPSTTISSSTPSSDGAATAQGVDARDVGMRAAEDTKDRNAAARERRRQLACGEHYLTRDLPTPRHAAMMERLSRYRACAGPSRAPAVGSAFADGSLQLWSAGQSATATGSSPTLPSTNGIAPPSGPRREGAVRRRSALPIEKSHSFGLVFVGDNMHRPNEQVTCRAIAHAVLRHATPRLLSPPRRPSVKGGDRSAPTLSSPVGARGWSDPATGPRCHRLVDTDAEAPWGRSTPAHQSWTGAVSPSPNASSTSSSSPSRHARGGSLAGVFKPPTPTSSHDARTTSGGGMSPHGSGSLSRLRPRGRGRSWRGTRVDVEAMDMAAYAADPLLGSARGQGKPMHKDCSFTQDSWLMARRITADHFAAPGPHEQHILPGQPLPPSGFRLAPAEVAAFVDYVRREAQLDDGVCCAALILLERVVVACSIKVTESNLRPLLVTAVLLASKCNDDLSMVNADFECFTPYRLAHINAWERYMLEAIAYNVRIRGSEYARYYFFLRDIAKAHHVERDAASSASTERLSILQKPGERFATSLESISMPRTKSEKSIGISGRGASRTGQGGEL